jgi:histidinol-phosphate aminotransferase
VSGTNPVTAFGLRDDLAGLEAYRAPQRERGIRLNTNESPFPPPPSFDVALHARIGAAALHRYPERDATELRARFAGWAGWRVDGTWLANGSNEVLQTLLLAFGGPSRPVLLFPPTYAMYPHLARVCATPVVTEALVEPWVLSPGAVRVAIERHDPALVIICSPNNPTGTATPLDAVAAALDACGGLVIVDQAYADFGGEDARALLPSHDRLVVTRSFSKSWRLAGARIGALLAHPWLVEAIQVARLPYHLSSLTQAAGLAALDVADEMLLRCNELAGNRDALAEEMRGMAGVEVFESGANFLLFRTPLEGTELWSRLAARGVLVRDVSGVIPRALRVTASTLDEQRTFLDALKESL